jgi:hypothetical protein
MKVAPVPKASHPTSIWFESKRVVPLPIWSQLTERAPLGSNLSWNMDNPINKMQKNWIWEILCVV